MKKVLACDLHDYLEIACMFQYRVELELDDGSSLTGTAVTTRITQDKEEVLVLKGEEIEELCVVTHRIKLMSVLTENARFKQIRFS